MKIERMIEAATEGKWYLLESPWLPRGCNTMILSGSPDPHVAIAVCDFECQKEECSDDDEDDNSWNDAQLISSLRNAAPALVALVKELDATAERMGWGADHPLLQKRAALPAEWKEGKKCQD